MTERSAGDRLYDRFEAEATGEPWDVWAARENKPGRDDFDPEMLPAQEKIRWAEQLIRRDHRVIDDDWMFWGNLADQYNLVALIPDKISQTGADWRRFNRFQDMATGYIRMVAAKERAKA